MPDLPTGDLLSASPLAGDLNFFLTKAAVTASRDANHRLKAHGLRVRSFAVLALATAAVPATQRDLADVLSLDPSQIVALIDELERDGLVERLVDPNDRRSRVIHATSAGHELFAIAQATTAESEAERLAPLSVEERATLRQLLQRVVRGGNPG